MTNPYDYSGRTVLVTGASRGIAAAIALGLARCGARIVLHYSAAVDAATGHEGAVERLVGEIGALGAEVATVDADLSESGGGRRMATDAIEAFGAVDSVVLSASLQIHKSLLVQTHEDIDRQLTINIQANIEALQVLLPPMARAGFGRILAVSSVQESAPSAEMPVYSLCKAALRSLVENVALQGGGSGITANSIAPGLVQTDRNAFRRVDMDSWRRLSRLSSPVGRAGQPDDMVGPALLLLAREASYLNGATLYATGGSHIHHRSADGTYPQFPASAVSSGPDTP